MMATTAKPMQPAQKSINFLFLIVLVATLAGCHFSSINAEFRDGRAAAESRDYATAIKKFDRVIKREPDGEFGVESARLGAKIAHYEIKDYQKAIEFYSNLVNYSENPTERKDSQKKIAEIYFENLNNYKKAIEEFNKLLSLKTPQDEAIDYKLKIAKANFYLNNFFQAESEVESALKLADEKEARFELLLFLGSIYYNTKRINEAIKIYEDLILRFPERSKAENVQMNVIVCYEELELFDKAIENLKKLRATFANPEFIDLKVKRLEQRRANLPGSRGLRK
jgi:tetratricopeptide (TPR) repeat protein